MDLFESLAQKLLVKIKQLFSLKELNPELSVRQRD